MSQTDITTFYNHLMCYANKIVYHVDYDKLIVGIYQITSITIDEETFEILMHLTPRDDNPRFSQITIPYKNMSNCIFNTETEANDACKKEATKKIDKISLNISNDLIEYMRSYLAITKQDPHNLELTKAIQTVVEFIVSKKKG